MSQLWRSAQLAGAASSLSSWLGLSSRVRRAAGWIFSRATGVISPETSLALLFHRTQRSSIDISNALWDWAASDIIRLAFRGPTVDLIRQANGAQFQAKLPEALAGAPPLQILKAFIQRDVTSQPGQVTVEERGLVMGHEILGKAASAPWGKPPLEMIFGYCLEMTIGV